MSAEIRRIRDRTELDAALALREEVFIVEQGVTEEGDRDGRDEEAIQLIAEAEDGDVVGTCRVLIEGELARFGRLAVRESHRRQGIAAALLAEAEREARAAGADRMRLHAQTDALRLYENAGYEPEGERFTEEGIEHQTMEKRLPHA
jgi:predicted GNAT family N-acyltransferase